MTDTRISQFETMTEADPGNELGHFGLGKAYMEAQRYEEATASLARVLELNPQFSKAYALLGQCRIKCGRSREAAEVLRRGCLVARERGDVKPHEEMAALLKELGLAPPAVREPAGTAPAVADAPASGFVCRRCGGPNRLPDAPMPGQLGRRILESICDRCWKEWIAMGTKVINELGLDFRSTEAQEIYDAHLVEYLGLEY